jgi:iron(III) transport system ATP-binding protein
LVDAVAARQAANMSKLLRVTHLTRRFGDLAVLAGVNLQLDRGDRLAVIGYSGSGKTTLLRLIAGLDVPTEGEIHLAGKLVSSAGRLVVPPERRRVAMVFQGLALFPHLRALDQIVFAARGRGGRARAMQLLERVGLGHRAAAPLDQLSGGERQRIALARALAQEPELLLMDEALASLDDPLRVEMRGLIRSLLDGSDTTLILVTHAREDALDLASRVLVLDRGHAVANDTLPGILANPQHTAAVRCLGLGQVIAGVTADGRLAVSAFGEVAIDRPIAPGPVRLLVRPGQARLAGGGDGAQAVVESVAVRPSDVKGVRHVAVVRVGGELLRVDVRVDVRDDAAVPGQPCSVRIVGPCTPVAGAVPSADQFICDHPQGRPGVS